jgi:hypothetical protein
MGRYNTWTPELFYVIYFLPVLFVLISLNCWFLATCNNEKLWLSLLNHTTKWKILKAIKNYFCVYKHIQSEKFLQLLCVNKHIHKQKILSTLRRLFLCFQRFHFQICLIKQIYIIQITNISQIVFDVRNKDIYYDVWGKQCYR